VTEEIFAQALKMQEQLVDWRRTIHVHPELALQEHRTSSLVFKTLEKAGIEAQRGASETGVVGLIEGAGDKTIALRADMDALPIQEETGVSYQSQAPGVMHACGHDGHTAMLLGSALILKRLGSRLKGKVKLIFQPAEEQSFIGRGGARQMVAEGVLGSPLVSSIAALHLDPDLPAGIVGIRDGTLMASSTTFEIRIRGQAGHGGRPHKGVDAIYLAAHVILTLQGVVARETDALDPKIITVGEIRGGTSPNIIAAEVLLRGTIRTLSSEMREKVQRAVSDRSRDIARALGGDTISSFQYLYPALVNNRVLADMVRKVCAQCPAVDRIEELATPNLGGDDFAFYSERVPGVMFRLGCSIGKKTTLHSATFDFDEKVLPIGTALLAGLAVKLLEDQS